MSERQQDSQDFAALLEEFERGGGHAPGQGAPKSGEKIRGTIISLGDEMAFVDLGAKSEGMVSRSELEDPGEPGTLTAGVGDEIEALVTGVDQESGCYILRVRPGHSGQMDLAELAQAREHGIPVEGVVQGVVKGGVEVMVAGVRGFCPISQLDLAYVEDAQGFVGQRLQFEVTKLEEGRGRPNLVLSRRALLEKEQAAAAAEVRKSLDVGVILDGTVSSVTAYGAFVDLGGGIEGLLHVSEMSHVRIDDPKELYEPGQRVEVEIVGMEEREGKERISLSRRSLMKDPWREAEERFLRGTIHPGLVKRLEPFGAFVELAPGVEGLLHVSQLAADRRVEHPREVVELGASIEVEILKVDAEKRRISLAQAAAVDREVEEAVRDERARQKERSGSFATLGDQLEGLLDRDR